MKNRLKYYIKLCNEVDNILINSPVRQTCIKCSTIKHFEGDYKWYQDKLGCCNGCKYLGENGCTTKSLACKLYICNPNLNKLLSKEQKERLSQIRRIAFRNSFYLFRDCIQEYKEKYHSEKINER